MQGIPTPSFQFMGIVRGKSVSIGRVSLGVAAWATDPVGTFILTLTNVVPGSSIQVETQSGATTLYNGVAANASPTINLSAYATGSPYNSLRVKVRKGTSSPYYQPYETLTTAFVGAQSIYVSQIPDE